MDMDGRLLSGIGVLAAIVDAGSFVGAAETLGLTQSGVSRAVARLEERVGVRLFERNARAVILTDEGRRFYDKVQPLFSELDEAVADVGRGSTAVRGMLRVNIAPLFLRFALAPRLPDFLAGHPELSLNITARDDAGGLQSEGFDVAVRFGEPALTGHVVRRVVDSRVVTCASPEYLARHGKPARPQDLTERECILFRDPATGRAFAWEFHRKRQVFKVPVSGRLTVDDGEAMLIACERGYGICQTMEFATPGLRNGRLVDVFPDWNEERWPLYIYFPSRRHPPAKVRAFVDFVLAATKASATAGRR